MEDFRPRLAEIVLNETLVDFILDSSPNFNYLYSSYSSSYYEPILVLTLADVPQSLINILYGSELDLIDSNRFGNQVSNPDWLRQQMCSNKTRNYLLRYTETAFNEHMCSNLSDAQLANLFTLISESIDWTGVKRKVNYEK